MRHLPPRVAGRRRLRWWVLPAPPAAMQPAQGDRVYLFGGPLSSRRPALPRGAHPWRTGAGGSAQTCAPPGEGGPLGRGGNPQVGFRNAGTPQVGVHGAGPLGVPAAIYPPETPPARVYAFSARCREGGSSPGGNPQVGFRGAGTPQVGVHGAVCRGERLREGSTPCHLLRLRSYTHE